MKDTDNIHILNFFFPCYYICVWFNVDPTRLEKKKIVFDGYQGNLMDLQNLVNSDGWEILFS